MKGYMIRTQGHGIHTDKVFLHVPSKKDVAAALAEDLKTHGQNRKTGEEREHWARFVEVEVVNEPPPAGEEAYEVTRGKFEGERPKPEAPRPSQGIADESTIEFAGEGRVIGPDDPDHPRNQRETQTITTADIAVLKL